MNKEKLTYLSPETETLVVQAEGVICESIIKTLAITAPLGGDKGFGDSAADVQDLSGENNWW